jgi:hypothetical protein
MSKRPTRKADPRRVGRLSIPDVQQELPPGGGGGSGGGGAGKAWTISGRLRVRESEVLGDGDTQDRDLKGIEVKVSASDLTSDGPWTDWGTVRTDATGSFSLKESNNGNTRFFRVQARLSSSDLEVNDSKVDDLVSLDLLDTNWRTVWKSESQREGPAVPVGTRVFAAGGSYDLGNETFRRQALIWYVLRMALDRLEAEDPWFALKGRFAAIYPAHPIGGTSYTNGLTRMLYLNAGGPDDDWHPGVVLHEFMHLWNYDHNHGTINWLGAVCSLRGAHPVDLDTHAWQENPNVAFAEGFSEFASNALRHELWGVGLNRPLNRRYLTTAARLATLEQVEKSDLGVEHALRVLRFEQEHGWWSHLLGSAEAYPPNRPVDAKGETIEPVAGIAGLGARVLPAGADHVSFWDLLRCFRASAANGWDTDLQVGNVDYGILRFIDRVCDIRHLGADVRTMLKRCIDPLATDEPRDVLATKAAA